MELRPYREEDAALISSWVREREEFFRWSANRLGHWPMREGDLARHHSAAAAEGGFFPFVACDGDGAPVGHLFIRLPDPSDPGTVRFGFVIVDPECRGGGMGREMLRLAAEYARDVLKAQRVTLGVFSDNLSARRCYEAVGFRPAGETKTYDLPIGEREGFDMELFL